MGPHRVAARAYSGPRLQVDCTVPVPVGPVASTTMQAALWSPTVMTDDKQDLAEGSDALLEALVLLRETERRMQAEHVPSARFSELAHEVHEVTDQIMRLVREQDELGDRI